MNLTPNALRMLDRLGVYQVIQEKGCGKPIDELEIFDLYSSQIASSSFRGENGEGIGNPPYKALRITRGDALRAVLDVVEKHSNIKLTCGNKTIDIQELKDDVTITFEDGEKCTAGILLGCDGIHSITRSKHVDLERIATYTGVCNAFGFAEVGSDYPVHFQCTAINFARRGMLLTSYHNPQMDSVYIGALMQVNDMGSRDGWAQVGSDAEKTRRELLDRFGDSNIACIRPLIERAKDFFLWPIYTLSKDGRWSTNRCMLLGDAAVSMIALKSIQVMEIDRPIFCSTPCHHKAKVPELCLRTLSSLLAA